MRRLLSVFGLIGALSTGLSLGSPVRAQTLPDTYFPESIARASDGTLYAGSALLGSIVRIRPGAAAAEPFVPAGANGLMSTQGLLVDEGTGRLYACTGDLGVSRTPKTGSALLAFDLRSGNAIGRWPLSDGGFCNDIVAAPGGDLFISDTARPRILRFDPGAGKLSVWAENPLLGGAAFNGNGIALDRNAVYLNTFADGRLLRVPMRANGTAGTPESMILPRPLAGADALRSLSPGVLLVFENDIAGGNGRITRIDLRGKTAKLDTIAEGLREPTSGVIAGDQIIVLESQFRKLFGAEKGAMPEPFGLRTIPLAPLANRSQFLPAGTQYPNGIAFDPKGNLFVGQVTTGRILRRDRAGRWSVFYSGSPTVFAGTALRVDAKRNILWGASPNFLFTSRDRARPHRIFALDIGTATLRQSLTLPDQGFGNDIAVAGDGTIFVTDSHNGRVLRLAPEAGKFETVAEDPLLAPQSGIGAAGIGAAGIVLSGDGRLIVGNYGKGLLAVLTPKADGRYDVRAMKLARRLAEPDGLLLLRDGSLVVLEGDVENGDGRVTQIFEPFDEGSRPIAALLEGLESPVNLTRAPNGDVVVTEARIRRRFLDGPSAPVPNIFRVISIDMPEPKEKSHD